MFHEILKAIMADFNFGETQGFHNFVALWKGRGVVILISFFVNK